MDQKVSDSKDDEFIGTAVHGQAPQGQSWSSGLTEAGKIIKASRVSCAAAPCPLCDPGSSTATLPASQRLPANYSPCVFPFTAKTLSTSPLCKMLLNLPWTLKTIQY